MAWTAPGETKKNLKNMDTLIIGSICYTDLVAAAKKGHSAFKRSDKNGKVYFSFAEWQKEEPDQYGNNFSLQLNPKKDSTEEKVFIGQAKYLSKKEQAKPVAASTAKVDDDDDLPF